VARFSLDPFRKPVVVSSDPPVTLSVADVGPPDAPETLLFIHGAGGRSDHFQSQVAYFSPRLRCVVPDLRGHGRSDHPPTAYTLDELMRDIDALVLALALPEKFTVIAHSFGGALAITYAATRPERVGKLILIATSTLIPLNPLLKVLFALPPWLLDVVRRAMPNRISCPARVLRKFIPSAVFPWNGWGLLPHITAPTLVVIGERDRVVPLQSSETMAKEIANARVEVVRYAAHMPILERPDAVNRAIERFIDERVRSWRGTIEEVQPQTRA